MKDEHVDGQGLSRLTPSLIPFFDPTSHVAMSTIIEPLNVRDETLVLTE